MAQIQLELVSWIAKELGYVDDKQARWREEVGAGQTVADLLASLAAKNSRFAEIVFDPADGRTYEHVAIVLNGRLLDAQGGPAAPLHDGDQLMILPGFAGG